MLGEYFFFGSLVFLPVYFGIVRDIAGHRAWKIGALCVIVPLVVSLVYLLGLFNSCGSSCVNSGLTFAVVLGVGGPVVLYGVGILIRATCLAISSPR